MLRSRFPGAAAPCSGRPSAVYAAVPSLPVFPLNVTWGAYASQASWTGQTDFVPLIVADVTTIPHVVMTNRLRARCAASAKATALLTGPVSLGIEAAQLLSYIVLDNGRSVDVDDVVADALGGFIGYFLLTFALRSEALRKPLLAAALPRSAALREDRRRTTASSDVPAPAPVPGPGLRH